MQNNKRTTKELFAYVDKQLSDLTDEEVDQVRRYLRWKYVQKRKHNMRNIYG